MKKILLFIFLFINISFANSSILILNSYHKGYEFSDKIVNAMEEEFYKNPKLDINILYMDSKRITSKEYFFNLKNLYEVQLKNSEFDLIITIDRFAYDFVLDNYVNLFKNKAVLSVGIESFSKEKALESKLQKVSALIEKRDLFGNIKLIEKSIDKLKKIYIINDISANATHTEPLIQKLLQNHNKNYELIYLRAKSLEELKKRFSKEEENSAILFIRFYKNIDGHLNKNQEIAKFIKNAKLPVYITDSIFIEKGAFGGKIVDLSLFGKRSVSLAYDILEKNSFQIETFNDFKYIFDEQKIKEFLIFPFSFVDEYILVNRSLSFYEKYKGFINFIFTISPLLIILIIALTRTIILKRRVEKDLRQRMEFDSVLLNAIESPIFWQDDKGKIIDSNNKFCNFINLPCSKIYGRSLDQLDENKKVSILNRVLKSISKSRGLEFKIKESKNSKKIYFIKQAQFCDSKTKKTGTVTILTDITKQKEAQKQKEKNQQFIIQQSKLAEIGEIFSSIAHQWKSPLVEITTIAQESFYNSNSSLSENESYVKDIMTQVSYMTETINDFQNFIIPSNEKKIFDAKEAINSMLEIINHNIKYNYIKVSIDKKEGTKLQVYGLRNEFMQAVLNIVNNAKDELLKKDLKNRELKISFFNRSCKLIIKIEDNAGGIKEKSLMKIFKAYYSTKKEGHGIGLYMAKMIIEDKMLGKINVSNTNNGACFEIVLENKE